MRWHPFAERFPLLEGEEWESFKRSIEASKGNQDPVTYRMVGEEKEYLDGRNRAKACQELGLPLKEEPRLVADKDVKAFILRRNVYRRHLTPEFRRQLVAELRQDGQSTRQIAESLGVSKDTVHRDLRAPGVSDETPEDEDEVIPSGVSSETPERVVGRDGKSYPASRPAPERKPLLCERCQRVGACRDCPNCAKLTKYSTPAAPQAEARPSPRPPRPTLDALRLPVSERLGHQERREILGAFNDKEEIESVLNTLVLAEGDLSELAHGPAGAHLEPRMRQDPGRPGRRGLRLGHLKSAIEEIRSCLPYAADCPYCHHAHPGRVDPGCKACKGKGWTPRAEYESAPQGHRLACERARQAELAGGGAEQAEMFGARAGGQGL